MRRFLRSLGWLLVLAWTLAPVFGQIREVPLVQRIDRSGVIVEGEVLASTPFYNPQGTMIHTAHRVLVSTVFKAGETAGDLSEVEIVTPGGQIGGEWHLVQPALTLRPGEVGLFFLETRDRFAGRTRAYLPYASTQGFVRYDGSGQGRDPFREYPDIARTLHQPIRERTGRSPRVVRLLGRRRAWGSPRPASHSISGFSPTTVRGGVQEVLTINGSGFGAFTGAAGVFFDDADDGVGGAFGAADAAHVISWLDTQIQVYVPNRISGGVASGTGKIIVRDSGGVNAISATDLTVQYALNEILTGSSTLHRVSLENEDARGGYTYRHSTNTANNGVDFTSVPGAVARFADAVEEWNCKVDWNVHVCGTTTVNATGNDGVNIVAFDNDADALPGGVLGRATSFFSSCGGDTWRVNGIDIRFKRDGTGGVDWYYGADPGSQGAGEDDFLSVALHELGHNVQHGHINDAADPMYFSITTGTNKRVLSAADVAGGDDIMAYSAPFNACGATGMIAFDCAAAPTADFVGDPLGVCGGSLAVNFADRSTNGPTTWLWDFGDGNTSTACSPSHTYTAAGTYHVTLTVSNANGSHTLRKTNYIVLTNPPVAAACNPTFTGHNNCCDLGPENVTFHSIDNDSGTNTDGDPLLHDFTCSQMTVVEAGKNYAISVLMGSTNTEDVRVYIDWNNDGTLAAGELAFASDAATMHGGTVSVPAGAVRDVALRMRVLSDFSGSDNIDTACENIEFGQVEEYSVLVVAPLTPGAIPTSPVSSLLTVSKNVAQPDNLDFAWGASCGSNVFDYTLHEGTVGAWYSHTAAACTSAGLTSIMSFPPGAAGRYYLVTPTSVLEEGSYGQDSTATERPVSATACLAPQNTNACP